LWGEPSKSLYAALSGTTLLSFALGRFVGGTSGALDRRLNIRLRGRLAGALAGTLLYDAHPADSPDQIAMNAPRRERLEAATQGP
jgi:hypothetical protein